MNLICRVNLAVRGLAVTLVMLGLRAPAAHAANFVLTNSDALGASSFNTAGEWSGGVAPAAGNTYQTSTNLLRTPLNALPAAFAGTSLEVQTGGSLRDKTAATITIASLILDNGATNELSEPNGVNTAAAGAAG